MVAMMSVMQLNVQAAGQKDGDDKTVADHFRDKQSSDDKADKQSLKKDTPLTTTSDTVWTFVKVVLVLALVIALIYLLLRFVHKRTRTFAEGRTIQNIGGVSVASNRSVQLIKVGERVFVVGVGESVSLLREIDDLDEVEQLTRESRQADVIDHSMGRLRDWLGKPRSPDGARKDFKPMFEDRLKQIKQERQGAVEQLKKKGPDK